MRLVFAFMSSLILGLLFWQRGRSIKDEQSMFTIFGSMFTAVILLGANNCSIVIPYIATERTVLYRERFAGMYSSWAYCLAKVTAELPYLLTIALIFTAITYPMIGYYLSAYKVFWYFYAMSCTLMSFNYMGMMLLSLTPNAQMATIMASVAYALVNLFSGFLIPQPIQNSINQPEWSILEGRGGAYTSILTQYQAKADYFACSCFQKNNGYDVQLTPGGLVYVCQWNNMQYASSAAFLLAVYSDYLSQAKGVVNCPEGTVKPHDLFNFAKSQADYILGKNPKSMSYLVGYETNYLKQVHHRGASICQPIT